MSNDTFDRFYNEFKDWSKEDILRRAYNIILDDADKTRQIEQLKKENNDLRRIYQNTYKKYLENGNEEMAHYFMAQIDACPTFYVEPVIDYYKEYYKLESSRKKVIEIIDKKMGNKDFDYIKLSMDEIVYLLNILNKESE